MRITTNNLSDAVALRLQSLTSQEARIQNQVSTGQRITNPGDDPSAMGDVLKIDAEKQQLTQFASNNSRATEISQSVYTSVNSLKSISDRAGELSALGSGVTSPDTYKADGAELNQLVEQAFQTINGQYNGAHMFGGTSTASPPFTATRDASGNITGVTYGGSADAAAFRVSESATLSPYTDGTTNQQLGDFVNHLVALRDAFNNQDSTAVQAAQPGLQTSEDNLIQAIGGIGATQTRLEAESTQTQSRFTSLVNAGSLDTDADVAQTVVRLTQAQSAYQAALASSSKMLNLSLLDYMPAT